MTIWLILCSSVAIVAYLVGSIPTGYITAKLLKGIDIREFGSGSTGATNILRTLGKGPGAFVLFIDSLKGVLAIFLVRSLFKFAIAQNLLPPAIDIDIWQPSMVALVAFLAILGHSKSIFLGFSGGKSVATSIGILFAMNWQVALISVAVFGVAIAVSRFVSLSSMSGALAAPVSMLLLKQPLPYIIFGVIGSLYVVWRHKANIGRLIAGTESKLGQKVDVDIEVDMEQTANPAS